MGRSRPRTLLLLRHAKSSWDDASLRDHDRPLAPRGIRAMALIADHLRSAGVRPGLVLCSSARRALDTMAAIRPSLGGDVVAVRVEPELYGAESDEILRLARTVDDGVRSVMVIGHNPGLEDLAFDLAGDGDASALTQLRLKFPTAALATLEFPDDLGWSKIGPRQGYLAGLVVPRSL